VRLNVKEPCGLEKTLSAERRSFLLGRLANDTHEPNRNDWMTNE
jgi:hypothetical protein